MLTRPRANRQLHRQLQIRRPLRRPAQPPRKLDQSHQGPRALLSKASGHYHLLHPKPLLPRHHKSEPPQQRYLNQRPRKPLFQLFRHLRQWERPRRIHRLRTRLLQQPPLQYPRPQLGQNRQLGKKENLKNHGARRFSSHSCRGLNKRKPTISTITPKSCDTRDGDWWRRHVEGACTRTTPSIGRTLLPLKLGKAFWSLLSAMAREPTSGAVSVRRLRRGRSRSVSKIGFQKSAQTSRSLTAAA